MKMFHKITMMLSLFLLFAVFTSGIITAASDPTPIDSGSDLITEIKDDNNDVLDAGSEIADNTGSDYDVEPVYDLPPPPIPVEERVSPTFNSPGYYNGAGYSEWQIRDFDGRIAKERADNARWMVYEDEIIGIFGVMPYISLNWKGDWKKLADDKIEVTDDLHWKELTDTQRGLVYKGSLNNTELIFINPNYFIGIDTNTRQFKYTGERIM